jgi:hypothetical protein
MVYTDGPMVWERQFVAGVALLVFELYGLPASAQVLRARGCEALDLPDLERKLQSELAIVTAEARPSPYRDIEIVCAGTRARISVQNALGAMTSDVELFGFERAARSRALALAVTELLFASELPTDAETAAEREVPEDTATILDDQAQTDGNETGSEPLSVQTLDTPTLRPGDWLPPEVEQARRERESFRYPVSSQVHALLSVRSFMTDEATFLGTGARFSTDLSSPASFVVDGLWERGTLGRTDVTTLTAGTFVMLNHTTPIGVLRLGIGSRLGGSTGSRSTVFDGLFPWGVPLVAAGGTLRAGLVSAELFAEGGYTELSGTSGRGAFVGIQLGLGAGLSRTLLKPRRKIANAEQP